MPLQGLAQQNRKADRWYVGAYGGLNSKTTHNDIIANTNGSFGIRLGYDQTRFFGYMGEASFFLGDVKFGASKCIIKAINADLMAVFNFTSLFHSSKSQRSLFEARLFGGFGINHICGYPSGVGNNNDLISKLGLDLGFNVGRSRKLYLFLEPAINYNLDHYSRTQYNINYSALQLAVGGHYRFSWSALFRGKGKGKQNVTSTGRELAESSTILTSPSNVTVPTERNVIPAKEEKPEVKPVVPVKEEKPEVKPVTPAKEEKPEVKPMVPAKEEKPEVKPVVPAKEEKKPGTSAKEEEKSSTVKNTAVPMKPSVPSVKTQLKGLTEVATFLKSHPKSVVVIRGDKRLAQEACNQLVRRYNINLNRITIQPEESASITFEVEI